MYNGETYDARLEVPNWNTPAGLANTDATWTKAVVLKDGPRGVLTPWSAPPVLLDRVIRPVNITQPKPGVFVVDFGVNVAGVVTLSNIKLPAGANVSLSDGWAVAVVTTHSAALCRVVDISHLLLFCAFYSLSLHACALTITFLNMQLSIRNVYNVSYAFFLSFFFSRLLIRDR